MNAIEAASRAQGEKIVHWTSALYKGVRKAVIWNTGPGMNAAELKAATDLACWEAFEADHPGLFGGMYIFWVQAGGTSI